MVYKLWKLLYKDSDVWEGGNRRWIMGVQDLIKKSMIHTSENVIIMPIALYNECADKNQEEKGNK